MTSSEINLPTYVILPSYTCKKGKEPVRRYLHIQTVTKSGMNAIM